MGLPDSPSFYLFALSDLSFLLRIFDVFWLSSWFINFVNFLKCRKFCYNDGGGRSQVDAGRRGLLHDITRLDPRIAAFFKSGCRWVKRLRKGKKVIWHEGEERNLDGGKPRGIVIWRYIFWLYISNIFQERKQCRRANTHSISRFPRKTMMSTKYLGPSWGPSIGTSNNHFSELMCWSLMPYPPRPPKCILAHIWHHQWTHQHINSSFILTSTII